MSTIIHINSIAELHNALNFDAPNHPLISLVNVSDLEIKEEMIGVKVVTNLYTISLKDEHCGMLYGMTSSDFERGVLLFTAPYQVIMATKALKKNEENGWVLYFHPDLIQQFSLSQKMNQYNFFEYEANEALHLSENEKDILNNIAAKIREEYIQMIDKHSQNLIVSNLELLLNYSLRFYERQFISRSINNQSILVDFESNLNTYLEESTLVEKGFPSIQYFAEKMNFSPNYLSDLLKKETGYSIKEHINNLVLRKAKNKLLTTNNSISEIAYSLGFNYPHYFTRFFSSKTGMTPTKFRKEENKYFLKEL
ncbi:helix-turn-helix domain-containing protein [Thalassobellus citreus]|uniref:helix-turn-helix domain-containing protein n=1 Tax=Thalassobellus citreus TaxID=3367752 RepID=UPI00378F01D6